MTKGLQVIGPEAHSAPLTMTISVSWYGKQEISKFAKWLGVANQDQKHEEIYRSTLEVGLLTLRVQSVGRNPCGLITTASGIGSRRALTMFYRSRFNSGPRIPYTLHSLTHLCVIIVSRHLFVFICLAKLV